MTKPLVSILMPVYNVEKYVVEAIDSMLAQTYTHFELIVLDDGSTDNSAKIIQSYSDKRIIYHKNEKNLGLANNLNVGLKMAKGKYIARMDGDDISLPERLQVQVDYLETHLDIDLCSSGLQKFGTENDIWIRESDFEQIKITMLFYSPVLHATSVWRRDKFAENHLFYHQDAFPSEDYDLWSRAVFNCKMINIPQVLYKYRIHGVQVTKTDDRVKLRDEEIKTHYLKRALPNLSEANKMLFVDKFLLKKELSVTDVKSLKDVCRAVLNANKKNLFFDESLLKKRLKKYYQNTLFGLLKVNKITLKSVPLLLDLRLKQLIKLLK